jgi:L-amino acid N-acyltransferase YncA
MSNIRRAVMRDVPAVCEIWRQGHSELRGEDVAKSEPFTKTISAADDVFQLWVGESLGVVVGWASLEPLWAGPSPRPAMGEISVYVAASWRNRGLGIKLMKHAMRHAATTSLEWVLAYIREGNLAAIRGCKHCGGKQIGALPAVEKSPLRETLVVLAAAVAGYRVSGPAKTTSCFVAGDSPHPLPLSQEERGLAHPLPLSQEERGLAFGRPLALSQTERGLAFGRPLTSESGHGWPGRPAGRGRKEAEALSFCERENTIGVRQDLG